MSDRVTTQVRGTRKVRGTEKLVLMTLATYANPDGTNAFPSQARLGRECGVSRERVCRIMGKLKFLGLIEVTEPPTPTRSARYRIVLDALGGDESGVGESPPPRKPGAPRMPSAPRKPVTRRELSQAEGVNLDPSTGKNTSHDLSIPARETCQYEPASPESTHVEESAPPIRPGFKDYVTLAKSALEDALRARDDSYSGATERFKILCAQRNFAYDGEITRKAVEAAMAARDKAAAGWRQALRVTLPTRRHAAIRAGRERHAEW